MATGGHKTLSALAKYNLASGRDLKDAPTYDLPTRAIPGRKRERRNTPIESR